MANKPMRRYSASLITTAAAAASLQSCLILCNPIDSSPPGSTIPGILQARTLEKCKPKPHEIPPARMAIIKKSINNKCWRGCGEKGTLLHYWWEWKLIQPLWQVVWRFLKKLGIKPPYDPAIPLLGICPEEIKIGKRHVYPNVHCSTIYNS